jgi:dienelactone hydrolase
MPHIQVEPAEDTLLDTALRIRIGGLAPGARVVVRLRADTLKAEASAELTADAGGQIDLASQAPIRGDYEGVDPMGLFWSARFDEGVDYLSMLRTLPGLEPLAYTLSVETGGEEVASMSLVRRSMAADVERHEVRDGRLRGTFFVRKGATNCPAVLVLGGSDGGDSFTFAAALLAAHGCAAMSLAYFAVDDLPRDLVEIPIEYFGDAIAWLRSRPETAGSVSVMGMSRGGELALLLGASYPEISAVAALVPSGVMWSGVGADPSCMLRAAWTLGGKPLPFVMPYADGEQMLAYQRAFTQGIPVALRPGFANTIAAGGEPLEGAAIAIERIRGPVLLVSAEDDQIWPSTTLSEMAEQRLRERGFAHPVEHRAYPGAGHMMVLPPFLPTTRDWARHAQVPMPMRLGGKPREGASASADYWPRLVQFLRQPTVAPTCSDPAPT